MGGRPAAKTPESWKTHTHTHTHTPTHTHTTWKDRMTAYAEAFLNIHKYQTCTASSFLGVGVGLNDGSAEVDLIPIVPHAFQLAPWSWLVRGWPHQTPRADSLVLSSDAIQALLPYDAPSKTQT